MITNYKQTKFDLTDKVAVVTGGCGLLGEEFAYSLLSAGAKVVIGDINNKRLKQTADKIKNKSNLSDILALELDITNNSSINNFIDELLNKYKGIDILVNSAAIDPKFEKGSKLSEFTTFKNFPLSSWTESVKVNLTGTFQLTQAICGVMEEYGKGSIINIGSNYGLVGPDQKIYRKNDNKNQSYKPVVYSVCKAGLIGFTKYLAAYYSGTDIRVNMLTPAGVYNNHDSEFEANYSKKTILGRMSRKEEYGGSIVFLASDASSYMTGANLIIDGGWTTL